MADEEKYDRDKAPSNDNDDSARPHWHHNRAVGYAAHGRGSRSQLGHSTGNLASTEICVGRATESTPQRGHIRGRSLFSSRTLTHPHPHPRNPINPAFTIHPQSSSYYTRHTTAQHYNEFLARRNGGIAVSAWQCSCERCVAYEKFLQGLERHVPRREHRKEIVQKIFKITKRTRLVRLEDKFERMTLGSGAGDGKAVEEVDVGKLIAGVMACRREREAKKLQEKDGADMEVIA